MSKGVTLGMQTKAAKVTAYSCTGSKHVQARTDQTLLLEALIDWYSHPLFFSGFWSTGATHVARSRKPGRWPFLELVQVRVYTMILHRPIDYKKRTISRWKFSEKTNKKTNQTTHSASNRSGAEGAAKLLQANISVLLGAPDVAATRHRCFSGDLISVRKWRI